MSNRLNQATQVTKTIQDHINGIIEIYEKRKLSLQSDMNYFDDANKSLLSLKASLDMYNEQQKKLSELSIANTKRQIGCFMFNLAPKFKDTQDAVIAAIVNLKQLRIDLIKQSQKFQSESSEYISQIKNAVKTYFENVTKTKQKKPTCAKETLELGKTLHSHYNALLKSIDKNRELLYSSIEESDNFLQKELESEDETVKNAVEKFFESFQINKITTENKSEAKHVAYYKNLIDADFFDLFSATGIISTDESQVKEKEKEKEKITFEARVWEDFGSDPNQDQTFSVKRRELVTVEKVTMNTYWLVKNSQGQTGMVPAAILEPLRTVQ